MPRTVTVTVPDDTATRRAVAVWLDSPDPGKPYDTREADDAELVEFATTAVANQVENSLEFAYTQGIDVYA